MSKLPPLQPIAVFDYFEQLCNIPHGSGNTKQISDYCVSFATALGLAVTQDAMGNVIIKKPATAGYEHSPAVMIQGHLDMVCVKDSAISDIDMTVNGLQLLVDGDWLYANGTSLGGDDGIAVAYALAILAANDLSHPKLEVVLTVDEEIGLLGAAAVDLSDVEARMLINIDSENEDEVLTSCAGGATAQINLPIVRESVTGSHVKLQIDGLLGGHSGVEIDKGRGNASKLMARVLYALQQSADIRLYRLQGGKADNVIPSITSAEILLPEDAIEQISLVVAQCNCAFKQELQATDPQVHLTMEVLPVTTKNALSKADTARVVSWMQLVPNGIQTMSGSIANLVESSLNLGILSLHADHLQAGFSVRSSVESLKEEQLDRLQSLTALLGGHCEVVGRYPSWEYKADSVLRARYCDTYMRLYGRPATVSAIHAGLECGFLAGKLDGLDCIAIGPNMQDIHSVQERLSISSVARVWQLLIALLADLK